MFQSTTDPLVITGRPYSSNLLNNLEYPLNSLGSIQPRVSIPPMRVGRAVNEPDQDTNAAGSGFANLANTAGDNSPALF